MKVLVIEDVEKTAAYLRKGLTEKGFVVDVAKDGRDGLTAAGTGCFDLILLDVLLPGCDGWSVLAALRGAKVRTPVLFLTACDSVEDRVKGLELGADDYLVKPFAFAELLARMWTILRRGPARQSNTLRVADLEIDPVRHRATRAGRRIDLTPKEFALLSLLVRRSGETLTRTLIAEQVWDMQFGGESNVVDVHMANLRAKLRDMEGYGLLRTVRGVGYALRG